MGTETKILVLDDNVDVAQGIADILELSGYDVTLVHDGQSAVKTYCSGQFDLGLFDVRMPGMNGVEAYLEIRRECPDAVVMLMSGYADEDLIKTAFDNGVIGMLSKPFEPDELLARLDEIASDGRAVA